MGRPHDGLLQFETNKYERGTINPNRVCHVMDRSARESLMVLVRALEVIPTFLLLYF